MNHATKMACLMAAISIVSGTFSALPANADDVTLHSADFESGSGGWGSFGGTTISTTSSTAHSGSNSLYVSGRTANWNGTSLSLDNLVSAGKTYQFSAWVLSSSKDNIQMTLKYTDGSGDQYKYVCGGDATNDGWLQISGSYTIPADATGVLVYFQTGEGTNDFMIDDVTITGEANWSTAILDETPLKDIYANYFRLGCAAAASELSTTISQDVVKHHFNSMTLGNELKPDAVLDKWATQASGSNTVPVISLGAAAEQLAFCEQNNIPIRGHVFCWYSQTPAWFFREGFKDDGAIVSKEVMNQRLENYIKALTEQIAIEYPKLNVYCWDVVNECYLDDGSLRAGGTDPNNQESYWSLIYGDNSYIEQAFTYARKYVPAGTKLFYNDFNEYIPAKRDAIYNMAKNLSDKGLIDGIGMQAHLDVGYPDANLFRQAIDKYDSLGLEVQITELDITDYNANGDSDKVTKAYHDIVNTIVDAKKSGANITALVFWGITDATSWRASGYPLLLNGDYSPKGAYYEVKNAVPESEWGKATESHTPTEDPQIIDITRWIGDMNNDAKINVIDLALLKRAVLNDTYDVMTADCNGDGAVNVADIIAMGKFLHKQNHDGIIGQEIRVYVYQ
ncbi:MAG: endo-1,4-beta-xylanase [Oscillospiraceae bacterium]